MKRYMPIIKDGLILIVVATIFVTIFNQVVKGIKKSSEADSIVTAIAQNNQKSVEELLSDSEYAKDKDKAKYATLTDYQLARANRTDEFGRTPAMRIAYGNFLDDKEIKDLDQKRLPILDLIKTAGADLNAQDQDGWTALMWASWSGLTQVATKLIEYGAQVNTVDRSGHDALMIAAMRGQKDVVQLLIEKGSNKETANKEGKKAKDFASESLQKYPERAATFQAILQVL